MNRILKNVIVFLLSVTPFTTIIIFNSLFFPFITGKAFFFRILVEIVTGLYLCLCVVDPEYRPKKSALSTCLWVFVGVLLIADIFSPNPSKAFWSNFERMEGFVALAHLALFFLVASSVFKRREDWNRLFFVSIGVSVYLIFFGLLQLSHEIVIDQGGARVDGTIGNAAYFAIYLVFQLAILALQWYRNKGSLKGIAEAVIGGSLGFIIYYLNSIASPGVDAHKFGVICSSVALVLSGVLIWARFYSKNEKLKRFISHKLFLLTFVLNLVLLYYTATRGAILGFIGGVILFSFVLIFQKRNKESNNLKKIGVYFISFLVLILIIFFSFKNTSFVQNSPVLSRFASITLSGTKDQARSFIWPMALEGVKEKPILGFGQEGFSYIFDKHYNPLMWMHEPWFDRAHNSFIDFFVAGGVLGLISYLSIFISALYLIFKRKEIEVFEKALLLGLLGAYTFNNMFVFDNLISYLFFFVFLAMIHSEAVSEVPTKHNHNDKEGQGFLIFFCLAITLVSVYLINIKPIIQNRNLVKAMTVLGVQNNKLLSCVDIGREKNEKGEYVNTCVETDDTIALFNKAVSGFPIGTTESLEQMLSTSQKVNRDTSIAPSVREELAKDVIDKYEKKLLQTPEEAREFLTFGSYLRGVGLLDKSLEILLKARELSPKKQQILFELASVYVQKNEVDKALEVAKEAYDEDNSNPDAVIYYAFTSLAGAKKDQFEKLVSELEVLGTADQRIVDAINKNYGKIKAQEYLNKVLMISPNNTKAKAMLDALGK